MFKNGKTAHGGDRGPLVATLISPGTVMNGNVVSESDLRIDGAVHGNVICSAKVVIGPGGYVKGNVEGRQADITGRVQGDINVHDLLQLREQSVVEGNIQAGTLQIDPTSVFNGTCKMNPPSPVILPKEVNEMVEAN